MDWLVHDREHQLLENCAHKYRCDRRTFEGLICVHPYFCTLKDTGFFYAVTERNNATTITARQGLSGSIPGDPESTWHRRFLHDVGKQMRKVLKAPPTSSNGCNAASLKPTIRRASEYRDGSARDADPLSLSAVHPLIRCRPLRHPIMAVTVTATGWFHGSKPALIPVT